MSEGHKKLQIYQQAHSLAVDVHEMTLTLPSFERFEEGSQIRRSSKSIVSNIVEGYALRKS
ncbi:MAG: four helix bundle protein [Ignavibacteriae bacterium]|nr:four helix bundle protein [Ignavibacteria bacterium]MBI3363820.1 four helix bundle protein [Ignavibacteriota bacterium]